MSPAEARGGRQGQRGSDYLRPSTYLARGGGQPIPASKLTRCPADSCSPFNGFPSSFFFLFRPLVGDYVHIRGGWIARWSRSTPDAWVLVKPPSPICFGGTTHSHLAYHWEIPPPATSSKWPPSPPPPCRWHPAREHVILT